jgi:hypothetical protein
LVNGRSDYGRRHHAVDEFRFWRKAEPSLSASIWEADRVYNPTWNPRISQRLISREAGVTISQAQAGANR